jgi:hypothetical protein
MNNSLLQLIHHSILFKHQLICLLQILSWFQSQFNALIIITMQMNLIHAEEEV